MFEMPAYEALLTEKIGDHILLVTMNRQESTGQDWGGRLAWRA